MPLCLGGSQADVTFAFAKHVRCLDPKINAPGYLLPHAFDELRLHCIR